MIRFRHLHGPSARRAPDRRERGETLVEVLGTVVLMGVGFTAVLSGLFTTVKMSDLNQQRTRAGLSVQWWAESLQQPAGPEPAGYTGKPQALTTYVPCANVNSYPGPTLSNRNLPAGYTAKITSVRLLQASASAPAGFEADGTPNWSAPSTWVGSGAVDSVHATCQALPSMSPFPDLNAGGHPALDLGLQEITITIDSGPREDRVIETMVVIKRDQRCPITYDNADTGPC